MLRTPTVYGLLALALFSCQTAGTPAAAPADTSVVSAEESAPVRPATAAAERRNHKGSLRGLLAGIEASVLTHNIDPRAHNVLNGWHGTVVSLPPNSIVYEDGTEPSATITVTLREYYTPAELIGARISTSSFGRLLEMAGAVLVEARAAGQPCKLREGKLMDIEFPYEEKLAGMQLFAGTREKGALNWNAIYDFKSGNRFSHSDATPVAHRTGIGFYSFHCPMLGMISCSRLTEQVGEPATLEVPAGPGEEASAWLLFGERCSLLEGTWTAGRHRFGDLPPGEPATLVIAKRRGSQLFLSVKWGITGDAALARTDFVAVSPQELKQKLKALARKPASHGTALLRPFLFPLI